MPDARNGDGAPLLTGPGGADTNPAGRIAIVLSHAVPVELNFLPAVLVGENLLAGGTDYDRCLAAVYKGPRRLARRTVSEAEGDAGEVVAVVRFDRVAVGAEIAFFRGMIDGDQHVEAVRV